MAGQKFGIPPILAEGSERTAGRNALRMNIMAARIVAETVKSTFGPMGMDKMLVDSLGDVTITNDGATIMREMDIKHPIAKMMIEVARTQEASTGDGTTTAVMFAGELLKEAEKMLDMGVHSIIIAKGYQAALKEGLGVLTKLAVEAPPDDNLLRDIALTTMTGKGVEESRKFLSDIIVDAVKSVTSSKGGKVTVDTDYIMIVKKDGAGIEESEFVKGLILEKEKAHDSMPTKIENASIALINTPLEFKRKEIEAQISITDPRQLKAFISEKKSLLQEAVNRIKKAGANVLISELSIDNFCLSLLAQENIFTVRRVRRSNMEKLAKATGARVINNIDEIRASDLGYAGVVEERNLDGTKMIYVHDCKEPQAVSILIRGGTRHIVDEVERVVEDCLGTLPVVILDGKVVYGGGALEIELARQIKNYAKNAGREQLAVEAYANALEVVPKTLAENTGLQPMDILTKMRSRNLKNAAVMGLDVFSGKIKDMRSERIIEPYRVKKQALMSATEVAIMILRIDDVIAAAEMKMPVPKGFGPEGPGGP